MIFKDFNLILPDRIEKGSLRVQNGTIRRIFRQDIPEGEPVRDGQGTLYLSPGFIDVHIHGAGGADAMDGRVEALKTISQTILRHGTTSFLPTTMTQSVPSVRQALRAIREAKDQPEGARILGVHLEGPFISPRAIGAQNGTYLLPPSVTHFQELTRGYEDLIRIVTLAPETEGALDLISYLSKKGICPSLGHTGGSYEAAVGALKAGAHHATHLFNAMPPLHHREPGVIGAVLDSDCTAELIADGIHLAYPIIRLVIKAKGPDQVILVSDAMEACAMPDGRYTLGGQDVIVKDGEARLTDGTLAGSVLTLDQAIRNLHEHTSLPLYEVVRMATLTAARLCGVEATKGSIEDGKDADLVIFDDDISIQEVYLGGERIH